MYSSNTMVREIVKPKGNTYILNLPDEMIGKTVEVIAFEVTETIPVEIKPKKTTEQLKKELEDLTVNMSDFKSKYSKYPTISHEKYKFDREEANDYE